MRARDSRTSLTALIAASYTTAHNSTTNGVQRLKYMGNQLLELGSYADAIRIL